VDGCPRDVDTGLKTWGQLLISLESTNGDEPTLVTAVRFRGVDQPSFRQPAVLASDLGSLGQIEVETASLRTLLASAAETVLGGLDPLAVAARRTGHAFRHADLVAANRGLGEFVGAFRALTELTALVHQLKSDDANFDDESRAFLQRLEEALESLIACDMNEDWISVADILEYDIAGMLPDWTALLQGVSRDAIAVRRAS
jgi:hypothetical protein